MMAFLAGMAEVEMVKHLGYTPNYYDYRTERIECDACYSYNYTAWALWFLQPDVEVALGVCGDAGESPRPCPALVSECSALV